MTWYGDRQVQNAGSRLVQTVIIIFLVLLVVGATVYSLFYFIKNNFLITKMPDSSAALQALPSIEVKALSYAFQDGSSGLNNVNLDLPAHSRTLLIGGTVSLPFQ